MALFETAVMRGTSAARPAPDPARVGRLYYQTDGTAGLYRDSGTAWEYCDPAATGGVATDAIWDAAGDLAVGSGANTAARLAMGTALQQLRVNAGATGLEWAAPSGGGGLGSGYILIRDEKASGTNGGTFTSGAWRTRDLNTEVADTGGHASVAGNQITLAAGTYRCRSSAPAYYVNDNQARLQDITNAATLLLGTSEYAPAADTGATSRSLVEGRFTLAGSTVLEVQHQCATTHLNNGFGAANAFGTQVYAVAEFVRE